MSLSTTSLAGEIGIRLLFSPLGSRIVARWACTLGGLGFPIYSSFKAIESNDKKEQEHWLCYWAAYGCFASVESLSDKILSWFPGYYHVKLLFLLWLQLPLSGGARYILANYLRPVLLKYESVLDGIVNGTRRDMNAFATAHMHEIKFIKVILFKLAQHVLATFGEIHRSLRNSSGVTSSSVQVESSDSQHATIPDHTESQPIC